MSDENNFANEMDLDLCLMMSVSERTEPDILDKLSYYNDIEVASGVASNPNTSDNTLRRLAYDRSESVRFCVASNVNTPASILEKLAYDPIRKVRLAIAENVNTPDNIKNELLENNFVMKNEKPEIDIMERLFNALNNYCLNEFEDVYYKSIDEIPKIISLAYTTTDNEIGVQVNFNLEKLQYEEYYNEELKIVTKRSSIEEFVKELEICDFESMIYDIFRLASEIEEEENRENSEEIEQ